MLVFALKAEERKILGKKVKTIRAKGKLPAVLYGKKVKPKPLEVDLLKFRKVYAEAGGNNLVDLEIGKKKQKVILHAIETDPVSDEIIHADLYAIRMDEKIKTEIPLNFTGRSKAVKDKEGSLITHKDTVEVEVLPGNLIDEIEVDITPLKTFDDVIKIKDLNIPESMDVLEEKEDIVANVTPPRSEEELEALEEEVEEDVEGVEIEKEKKEEDEETEGEGKPKEEASGKEEEKSKAQPEKNSSKETRQQETKNK